MATVKAPSGRTIWKAVREELVLNLYPLPFSTLAPSTYHVYLHPDDFAAIEGITARLAEQIARALTTEVERMNRGLERTLPTLVARLFDREQLPPIEMPAAGWEVHVRADRNGELQPGQLGIVSTLALPAPVEYGGTPTTRIVRSVVGTGGRSATTMHVPEAPGADGNAAATVADAPDRPTDARSAVPRETEPRSARDRALLRYRDDQGAHEFVMRKDSLSIGRGGSAAWVDVQVVAGARVSREHLRLHATRDGRFVVQDVSLWGTSVDGVPIPPAVKSPEGVAQPGAEHPLPARARISLADVVTIEFEALEPA